jgi:predicted AlkP superfamily pyrophosphatase or phosphodiesterase
LFIFLRRRIDEGWRNRYSTHKSQIVQDNYEFENGEFDDYPLFFKRLRELRPAIRIAAADPTTEFGHILLESCGGWINLSSCLNSFLAFKHSEEGDFAARDEVLDWISGGRYDLLWYHLIGVDSEGHDSGWDGDSYNNLVEKYDREIIGPLLEAIAAREQITRDRWLIIVTADHGGHNTWFGLSGNHTTRESDMKVPIIVSGTLVPNQGDQGVNAFNTWDLPATIYRYFDLTPNPSWPTTDGNSIIQ